MPVGAAGGSRPATLAYLGQIARSAEQLGYVGALTPTGAWCEDAFIVDSMLASVTRDIQVPHRHTARDSYSPTLAAQITCIVPAYFSKGRLLLNVVVGGETHEQRAYADFSDKAERYERADEFLQVVRALWERPNVSFTGRFYQVENATLPLRGPIRCRRSTSGGSSRRCRPGHRPAHRCLSHLGRTDAGGSREDCANPQAGSGRRPDRALRHPPACHSQRHRLEAAWA